MLGTTCLSLGKSWKHDIETSIACDGRLQMTCGEHGCEQLCYPIPQ